MSKIYRDTKKTTCCILKKGTHLSEWSPRPPSRKTTTANLSNSMDYQQGDVQLWSRFSLWAAMTWLLSSASFKESLRCLQNKNNPSVSWMKNNADYCRLRQRGFSLPIVWQRCVMTAVAAPTNKSVYWERTFLLFSMESLMEHTENTNLIKLKFLNEKKAPLKKSVVCLKSRNILLTWY